MKKTLLLFALLSLLVLLCSCRIKSDKEKLADAYLHLTEDPAYNADDFASVLLEYDPSYGELYSKLESMKEDIGSIEDDFIVLSLFFDGDIDVNFPDAQESFDHLRSVMNKYYR